MDALNTLIEKHPRWGFWMCYDRLRLTGHRWNHKRVYRVYTAMKLNLPLRKKRRLPARDPRPMAVAARANAEWSMDFMADALYHGRRFRTLNVLDEGVGEALDIVIDTSTPGGRVVRTLDPPGRVARPSRGDSRRQRTRIPVAGLPGLVPGQQRHAALHSARQAESERLY